MSLNPLSEVRYRYRLASEHLSRAERMFEAGDWVGTVLSSQLAVENFAKAVVAAFEVPTWSHDPSGQLEGVASRAPPHLASRMAELARMARELAPEHGRATYGEPSRGLTPGDIYKRKHAEEALEMARRAKGLAEEILAELGVSLERAQ